MLYVSSIVEKSIKPYELLETPKEKLFFWFGSLSKTKQRFIMMIVATPILCVGWVTIVLFQAIFG